MANEQYTSRLITHFSKSEIAVQAHNKCYLHSQLLNLEADLLTNGHHCCLTPEVGMGWVWSALSPPDSLKIPPPPREVRPRDRSRGGKLRTKLRFCDLFFALHFWFYPPPL